MSYRTEIRLVIEVHRTFWVPVISNDPSVQDVRAKLPGLTNLIATGWFESILVPVKEIPLDIVVS